MAMVRNPDGSITVGIIPEPKEEAKEPAPKRGGKSKSVKK